ncbi:Rieske (2Fe-2S) protein [Nocardioidaceae bacterium]|nr:Rieske (2Fe-2S) protein [Nocardioidaceae bacterium]
MSEQTEAIRPCQHAGPTRRGVLAGVAGVGGACLLAACGSSSGGSSSSGSGSASAGEGDVGSTGTGVPVAEVAVGGGVIVGDVDAPYVVTQPTEGEFKAFSAVCTHQSCTVSSVSSGTIVCACHNSEFDATTGEVLGGPAPSPLPELSVTQEGDTLVVQA